MNELAPGQHLVSTPALSKNKKADPREGTGCVELNEVKNQDVLNSIIFSLHFKQQLLFEGFPNMISEFE